MRSTSIGWMKLKSASPLDHPVLQPNYLSTGTTLRCALLVCGAAEVTLQWALLVALTPD